MSTTAVSAVNVAVPKSACLVCRKMVRLLSCGHAYHAKCLVVAKKCTTCSATIKHTEKQACLNVAGATQRMTTGVNGNAFITVSQQDEWGRTTVTREIFKDKVQEFTAITQSTAPGQCGGNIGLMFMQTLMGIGSDARQIGYTSSASNRAVVRK